MILEIILQKKIIFVFEKKPKRFKSERNSNINFTNSTESLTQIHSSPTPPRKKITKPLARENIVSRIF